MLLCLAGALSTAIISSIICCGHSSLKKILNVMYSYCLYIVKTIVKYWYIVFIKYHPCPKDMLML